MRNYPFFQSSKIIICAGLLASVVTGCAIVDDVGLRSESLNDSMARYNNHAILLNIVRASEYEPLNFVAVTQASPNTSFQGNLAAPSFAFNVNHLATTTIQGNSLQSTASNQLTILPIDDPASWQAVLTPIDVGTIGFFIKQGYPPEILFWLFVDRLKITKGSQGDEELVNDPGDPSFERFSEVLPNLILGGLTVEVERGAPKSGQSPASVICFRQSVARAAGVLRKERIRTLGLPPGRELPVPEEGCTDWPKAQATDTQSANSKVTGSITGPILVFTNPKIDPKKLLKKDDKPPEHTAWYDLPNEIPAVARGVAFRLTGTGDKPPKGSKIQLSTRSPYAVYLYLGHWLRGEITPMVFVTSPEGLVTIVRDRSTDCFTQVFYRAQQFCVPQEAYNTKITFAMLHQIAGLNIAHAATPPPLTVRTVP